MDTYSRVAKNVEPKKQALALAEKQVPVFLRQSITKKSYVLSPYKLILLFIMQVQEMQDLLALKQAELSKVWVFG
jgi:hypothetical protein